MASALDSILIEHYSWMCSKWNIKEVWAQVVEDAESKGTLLGKGTFGSCYLLEESHGPGICVKIFHEKGNYKKVLQTLYDEAKQTVWATATVGMVRLIGVSLWPKPALLTEFAGDNLKTLLKRGRVSPYKAVQVIAQVAAIILELTDEDLAHGDLKLDNITVRETRSGPIVTLIDLGLLEEFGYNPGWKFSKENSVYAPELLLGYNYSPETQVYQMGKVMTNISKFVDMDPALKELARCAIKKSPDERPTIDEILKCAKNSLADLYLDKTLRRRKHI